MILHYCYYHDHYYSTYSIYIYIYIERERERPVLRIGECETTSRQTKVAVERVEEQVSALSEQACGDRCSFKHIQFPGPLCYQEHYYHYYYHYDYDYWYYMFDVANRLSLYLVIESELRDEFDFSTDCLSLPETRDGLQSSMFQRILDGLFVLASVKIWWKSVNLKVDEDLVFKVCKDVGRLWPTYRPPQGGYFMS